MSTTTYDDCARISDSLERELMRDALSCGEAVSVVGLVKNGYAGLGKIFKAATKAVYTFSVAFGEARAESARLTYRQW